MPKLVAQSGPSAGKEYLLRKDATILGRQSASDVQVIDNMASRAHAQVRRDGRFFSLVDLGSRNGTLLNGKKVSERVLTFGDRIRIGEVELLFVKEPGDIELKDLITRYVIMEKIGEGGMGIVYKANQTSMARIVALKILAPKYASRSRFVDQFIREARAAGQLNHPNIIQVHDVGTENDLHYFSMEYVDGPTCAQVLKEQGAFEPNEALEVVRQTARALDYAHGHRLIHQDIKPDNIMIGGSNVVKLADLGISKTFDEAASTDAPRKIMGTPHYMAPEACLGKRIDHRIDIYSLGATLYQLLSAKTPFHGASPTDVLKAHVMEPLPPLKELRSNLPEPVIALVERMLAKQPEDRFQTALEVHDAIQKLQETEGLGPHKAAGSSTVILKRLAEGRKAGVPAGNVPAQAENRTPTAGEAGPVVDEAGRGVRTAYLVLIVALVLIAVAAGIGTWMALGGRRAAPASETVGDPVHRDPGQGNAQPRPPSDTTQGGTNHDQQAPPTDPITSRLMELESLLKKPGSQVDLAQAQTLLAGLPETGLAADLQERRSTCEARLKLLAESKRVAEVKQSFTELEDEVRTLTGESNFTLALQRIAAYRNKDAPAVAESYLRLKTETEAARKRFSDGIEERLKLLQGRKDGAGLKALRDRLPQAWLGSELEGRIAAAIKALEDERLAQFDQAAQRCARALAKWDFPELERLIADQRRPAEGTAAATRMDQYAAAAKQLALLQVAIARHLAANQDLLPRYRGMLGGSQDPDLVAADGKSIELKDSGGGTVFVPWNAVPVADLVKLAAQLLGAKEAEGYKAALTVLEQSGKDGK